MALPRKKPVIVHWTDKETWRTGPFWFDKGPNLFTREQYKKLEFRPLFIRQVAAGKAIVEDPERPKAAVIAAVEPKRVETESVVAEGVDADTSESNSKRRGRRRDFESTPS